MSRHLADGFFPFHAAEKTLLQWTSADHMRNATATWKFSFELLLNLWKLDPSNLSLENADCHYNDWPTPYSGHLACSHVLPGANSHKESF